MQYVQFTIRDGNLVVTLLPAGREHIAGAAAEGQNTDSDVFMLELFEHPLCNGWEEVRPEEIGALTSAPIFSDTVERDEAGTLVKVSRVYWFPNYQIESPVGTLVESGEVVFTGVE